MRVIPPTAAVPLLASCGVLALCAATSVARADGDQFLRPHSLLISTSTYDRTKGAVASLAAGTTQLANTNTATAVVGNLYPEVWNNASVDGSFGVTNFRGLSEYQGALYFTKGSGSNGMDTV